MERADWLWPGGRRIAVVFNICLEAWSDGKAPGISPMGNPLPAGLLDSMAISWAEYGPKRGMGRLMEALGRYGARSTVLANAVIAERRPEVIRAAAEAGHEIASHSYAMDVIPLMLDEAQERANIRRCTDLLEQASGRRVTGWLSPRATSGMNSARLLAEAGYRWIGDTLDDDLPYLTRTAAGPIVTIPLVTDVNDMPFMKYGNPPALMLESFRENIEIALARPGDGPRLIDVTIHAHIFGRPRGAWYVERIAELAARTPEVWIGTRGEIAEGVLAREGAMGG
ncbi:polysaccharide deacetylase family protein [Falsiroseomonas sp. CW058]|uniref:polysaccharide deacetylase family protein n=1 Tax=Falsiroseomonas sp. CW058 TaxID=3388664 RepID=UPI003D318A0D